MNCRKLLKNKYAAELVRGIHKASRRKRSITFKIRLERLYVNSKIDGKIIDGISYIMDGKILIVKNRVNNLNLPSLGFTMIAGMEDENRMSKRIVFNNKELLVQS